MSLLPKYSIELVCAYKPDLTPPFREGRSVRIYEDGFLEQQARYEAKIGCPLDFSYFPFDHQGCKFSLYLSKKLNCFF